MRALAVHAALAVSPLEPGDPLLVRAGVAASPVADDLVGVTLSLPALLVGAPIRAIAGAQPATSSARATPALNRRPLEPRSQRGRARVAVPGSSSGCT